MTSPIHKGSTSSPRPLDYEADIHTPLLLGNMEAETKNPHDVRSSSADSRRLDSETSNYDALEKKAPWWSYIWVRRPFSATTNPHPLNDANYVCRSDCVCRIMNPQEHQRRENLSRSWTFS